MATSNNPWVNFGLSCPDGGDFHICQDSPTRFIGCCDVDPCTSEAKGNCPLSHLFNASFSADIGVKFEKQACEAPAGDDSWYTCQDARPPFLGCCKNDPCNNGCNANNLIPARLSDDPKNASQFLPPVTTSSSSSSSSSPSPTGTSTTGGGEQAGSNGSRVGIITGVTLGGVLILLAALTAYLLWKKRKEEALLDNKVQPGHGFDRDASVDAGQAERFFQGAMSTTPRTSKGVFSTIRPSHELEANASSPLTSENFYSSRVSQLSELEDSSRTPRSPHPNLADTPHPINELE